MDTAKPLLHVMPPWMSRPVHARLQHLFPEGGYDDKAVRSILETMRTEIAAVLNHPLGAG